MSDSRRVKFKTLDNKITEVEVSKEINVPDLKKTITEKLGIPVESQRLIYKGKQLKDDKKLIDYITEDDEIIHLMTRMVEQSQGTTEGTTNTNTNQSNNQNTTSSNPLGGSQPNANPFGNILGNILSNPNTMIQMTSMILGGEGGGLGNLNNLLGGMTQTTNTQSSNQSQTRNDINSVLQNLLNPPQNQQGTTNQSTSTNNQTRNSTQQSSDPITTQYPLLKQTNDHLAHLERVLDSMSNQGSSSNSSNTNFPTIPNLNYPLNVLTALGVTLRRYTHDLSRFLPYLSTLSDCLERESLMSDPEEREKVKKLVLNIHQGIEEITKSTSPLQPILQGLDYGNAPGTGSLRLVATAEVQMSIEPNLGNNLQSQPEQNNNQTSSGNANTQLTQNTSQSTTNQSSGNTNPLQQIISEMQQPGNMQMMMNMVGNLMGGQNRQGGGSGNMGGFGNLLSQLMGNLGGEEEEAPEVPQNTLVYLRNVINDNNLRKSTTVNSIPENILKFDPQTDFAVFVKEIIGQMTVQEVVDLNSFNFRCFTRLRNQCRELIKQYLSLKYNNDKSKCVENLTNIFSERLIIAENENDKLTNTNFNIETHISKYIQKLLDLFLDESSNDIKFETQFKNEFFVFIGELFYDLASSYNTGKEGAFYYLDCNLEDLLIAVVGQSTVDVLFSLDEHFLEEFTDNMIDLYENLKIQLAEEKGKQELVTQDVEMAFETIMEIAQLDKQRHSQFTDQEMLFSEEYKNTSLYK